MSKQFANSMSIECKDIEERDKVAKILESVGWGYVENYFKGEWLYIVTYKEGGKFMYCNHLGSYTTIHITDIHEPLIRDLAAMCTNDTWQEGERWMFSDGWMSKDPIIRLAGKGIGYEGTLRPTAKEICEHHGFEILDDGNVVRKQPKLEDITTEPETCFKTDDGYYIHDGEVFYRVLPDYSVEKCVYKNGMRVFDKDHVLARLSRIS